MAGSDGDACGPALERSHPLLEYGVGGIADAAIDIAESLQTEQRGRMIDIIEHERRRLVDRRCAGPSGWVGLGAGMHGKRRKAGSTVGHGAVPRNDGDRLIRRSGFGGKPARVRWRVPLM